MRKILTLAEFRKQAKGSEAKGLAGAVKLYKETPQIVRAASDVKITEGGRIQVLNITSSDSSVDREDDTIRAAGWKLANYKNNPVVLWAHNSRILPVARAIRTEVLGDKLQQDFEFTDADMQHSMGMGYGHTVGRMFQEGFLNAVSVGFSPLLWQFDEDRWGVDFLEQELLETSPVTIPANPNALAEAGKRMVDDGVDLAPVYEWAERCLDGDDGLTLVVPRKSIELTHSLLAKSLGKTERAFVDLGAKTMPNATKTRVDGLPAKGEKPAADKPAAPDKTADDAPAAKTPDLEAAATAAAEASKKVEADALKSIDAGLSALKAIGGVTDTDAFKAIAEKLVEFGVKAFKAPVADDGGDVDPEQKTIKLTDGKDSVMISQKDIDSIVERAGEVAKTTIATLTGRLN